MKILGYWYGVGFTAASLRFWAGGTTLYRTAKW